MTNFLTGLHRIVWGAPTLILILGTGLFLSVRTRFLQLRLLPRALRQMARSLRRKPGEDGISPFQALCTALAATVGTGNLVGVAGAICLGGPGAIFWMWVSAMVGMCTKYHEGTLAIMYKGRDDRGNPQGGPMHIIEQGMGRRWRPLARFFAIAGLFGTLCIMNANQLTEAFMTTFTSPDGIANSSFLAAIGSAIGLDNSDAFKLLFGIAIALIVASVILGGIRRIASVASVIVPFMVGVYFLMVLYIIITHAAQVPGVFASIISDAFSLDAGIGGLVGTAIIGARRAALVNDAGIGTASIMHGASRNNRPVREGLIAMLGPSIDSGLVCTLTALAILLCGDIHVEGVKGLAVAMQAFRAGIPYGDYLLMFVVICFALSSMFSYSFYGTTCAAYLFGTRRAKIYVYSFIASLIVFAVVPLEAAVGLCDLFYAFMALPTMIAVLSLSPRVRRATKEYFSKASAKKLP